ncbi:hypothetical protein SASPL_153490 [Salvia splendens]|uniref:General vesicular transport factor p115 n=1 Tax=Salvia splendens TaxID=180675 RepID=A0A8X8Z1U3_SALSN|nr:hypothetical protein SASPL_153490 [Salvia splendens]
MDFVSKYQGVVGRVFGNENLGSSEDSYVELLLDRISNGVLADDKRNALAELQAVVAESNDAQLAFGAMGFPILLNVLKEEREDVEMSEEDFYIRYYTLQLLTAFLTNSPNRLQESILTIPRGITRVMDMLMDREVIRNEALLLLTYLTREAEEIQKIVVFEGALEKIFGIIKEEGGSEGGVIVQVLLRETLGFDPLMSILQLRGSTYKFTQQKTINLLSDTVNLLLHGGQQTDPGKDSNSLANKTVLDQKNVLNHLLMLGVESQWAPVAVRCMVLQCIGDLVVNHPQNRDALANKALGEEPHVEPALNSLLRVILQTSSSQEFIAADYVFKSFCEKNPDGQTMLASTLIPQPLSMINAEFEEDVNMSFGSMLLHRLILSESDGDLETCCRAAGVLSHILKDNIQCMERVLKIELEAPTLTLGGPEPLLYRMIKYLALASSISKDGKGILTETTYLQPIILKLLLLWLFECPSAVQSFLEARPHFTYLLELISSETVTVCVKGLSAVLLGVCIVCNKTADGGQDAFSIIDAISQKVGLTSYLLRFDEMQKSPLFTSEKPALSHKPLTRSISASMSYIEEVYDDENADQRNEDHPILQMVIDPQFVDFLKGLEVKIREQIVEIYSRLKSQQCREIQDLLSRNATLAEDLSKTGGSGSSSQLEHMINSGSDRILVETLRRDVHDETCQRACPMHTIGIEQANFQLEREIKALKSGGAVAAPDIEEIKAEAREVAQREGENELLVCLGQEQSKVEKLSAKLAELGEDVDSLLDGIGDDVGMQGKEDDDEQE